MKFIIRPLIYGLHAVYVVEIENSGGLYSNRQHICIQNFKVLQV